MKRALSFTRNDTSAHGLPLLGFADWNDTINLPTGAESLFTANLYGWALREFIALLEYLGWPADEYRLAYEEMKSRLEEHGWDGKWYVRYFDEAGDPLGSSKNTYGQIYLNGQSWPVISGFASPERAAQAMQSVYEKLNTKYGIKLSAPGFNGFDPKYGGVTTYPPGAKENGGIFLHPNPWAMIAEALLGNGDRAYEYSSQINPAGKSNSIELYEIEPYVYAQYILGDEHPQFGLGRNSWLSGTAAWCYQAATQSWLKSSHHTVAVCVDCHLPHDFVGKYIAKGENGYHHSVGFTFQDFHEPIMIKPKNARILEENCLRCHGDLTHELMIGTSGREGDLQCVHCHQSAGHGDRAGLGGWRD